jgi:hypothetical protein
MVLGPTDSLSATRDVLNRTVLSRRRCNYVQHVPKEQPLQVDALDPTSAVNASREPTGERAFVKELVEDVLLRDHLVLGLPD